ncbi:hypothetical protein BC834DRAFT_866933, partial [Gloeopeniophorella convolvens]
SSSLGPGQGCAGLQRPTRCTVADVLVQAWKRARARIDAGSSIGSTRGARMEAVQPQFCHRMLPPVDTSSSIP